MTFSDLSVLLEEMARSFSWAVYSNGNSGGLSILQIGNEIQKNRYLPEMPEVKPF